MVRVLQLIFRIIGGSLVLSLIVLAIIFYIVLRSIPDYEKTLELPGIVEPIEIVRDTANVPHIYANNDNDLYFGLGYAHAQDRLWQMVVNRLTVQGRLSEIFGKQALPLDEFMRRLDIYSLSQKSVDAQDNITKKALEAYAAGINARFLEINRMSLGRGAPELLLYNIPLAAWHPADSIALLKLFAVNSSSHYAKEILRSRTLIALPDPKRVIDILPNNPTIKSEATTEVLGKLKPNDTIAARKYQGISNFFNSFVNNRLVSASNSFAASDFRTASDGTLLANDPHFKLSVPSQFYLAHLDLSVGGVIGGTIPGIPTIITGRTPYIAWGISASFADDQDLYAEEISQTDVDMYRSIDGWIKFKTEDTIIKIRGEPSKKIKLKWSENGPVLDKNTSQISDITPSNHEMALSWTMLSAKDTSMSSLINLPYSKDLTTALKSLEKHVAPSLNYTIIDKENIALQLAGKLPKRNKDHNTQGRLPSFGYIEKNRWLGYNSYSDNPRFINPKRGLIANTNNKVLEELFPNHISFDWGDSQRIERLTRLLESRKVHTRESFIEAQLDTVSFPAKSLLPIIGANLWYKPVTSSNASLDQDVKLALKLLAEWNGEMNEHLPEPLIFYAWMRRLQKRLIQDELGVLAAEFGNFDPIFLERVFRNIDGASVWCDIVQSISKEDCDTIAELALYDAISELKARYKVDITSMRWGDAHIAMHDHLTLGHIPFLNLLLNLRQSVSGGDYTLQRGLSSGNEYNPFENVHAAVYRGVYDFSDPDSSLYIISTGQSGHLFSRHYDDLGQLWRRGEYISMSLDPELAKAASNGTTKIIPASNLQ